MLRSKSEPNKCTKRVHGCRTQNNTVQCAAGGGGGREYGLRPVCYNYVRTFHISEYSCTYHVSTRIRVYSLQHGRTFSNCVHGGERTCTVSWPYRTLWYTAVRASYGCILMHSDDRPIGKTQSFILSCSTRGSEADSNGLPDKSNYPRGASHN